MSDRLLTSNELSCAADGIAHPSRVHKAGCPICNPTKTVPELNAAAEALSKGVTKTRRDLTDALARDLRQLDLESAAVFVESQQTEIERLSGDSSAPETKVNHLWLGPGVTYPCGCRSSGPRYEPPWYCAEHNKGTQETSTPAASLYVSRSDTEFTDCAHCDQPASGHAKTAGRCPEKAGGEQTCPHPEANGMSIQDREIAPGVYAIGEVHWNYETRDWRCLANVNGALCVVQVQLKPLKKTDKSVVETEPKLTSRQYAARNALAGCTCGSDGDLHQFTCQLRRDGDDGKGAVKALALCDCEGQCRGVAEAARWGRRCRVDACKDSNQ